MKQIKSLQGWSWSLLVAFFVLSYIDVRFAILGLLCMMVPLVTALMGHGKLHCSHFCPRGSFLGKFFKGFTLNNYLPKFMMTKAFKVTILVLMMTAFSVLTVLTGLDYVRFAGVIRNMIVITTIISIISAVVYRPRSWCQFCPMGTASGLIRDGIKN